MLEVCVCCVDNLMKRNQGTRNFSLGRRRAVKKDDMHADIIVIIILLYK